MGSSPLGIEITIISAENLRLNGKSVKRDAFVVLKTDPLVSKSTRSDHERGSNPIWNEKLEMEIASNCRFITLQAECRVGSRSRVIGAAAVPVSDFVGGYFPANYLHFLSYRLRDARGEKNGIVNFSVRVKGLTDCVSPPARYASAAVGSSCPEVDWGFPAQGVDGSHGGVVTGVPFWFSSNSL